MTYGIAIMSFAFSHDVWLSLADAGNSGHGGSVSVFVRQSLVQIVTPDICAGASSAVASLFISASNELGEFESGVAARLLGVVGSAVFGGVGSIVVTLIWSKLFPALRRADKLVAPNR